MRDFKPESHGLAQDVPFAISGTGLTLMAMALLSARTPGLLATAGALLTAYLAWRVAGLARHRGVPLPSGRYAVTDAMEAHVERVDQSERRFGAPSRKSCDPTI